MPTTFKWTRIRAWFLSKPNRIFLERIRHNVLRQIFIDIESENEWLSLPNLLIVEVKVFLYQMPEIVNFYWRKPRALK